MPQRGQSAVSPLSSSIHSPISCGPKIARNKSIRTCRRAAAPPCCACIAHGRPEPADSRPSSSGQWSRLNSQLNMTASRTFRIRSESASESQYTAAQDLCLPQFVTTSLPPDSPDAPRWTCVSTRNSEEAKGRQTQVSASHRLRHRR